MSTAKSQAEPSRAQNNNLVTKYRAIGPAAVLAAVLANKKKNTLALHKVA